MELNELHKQIERISRKIKVGSRYYHYKNKSNIYTVLHIGFIEALCEPAVIYKSEYGPGLIWIRPVKDFLGTVLIDGHATARFTEITD